MTAVPLRAHVRRRGEMYGRTFVGGVATAFVHLHACSDASLCAQTGRFFDAITVAHEFKLLIARVCSLNYVPYLQ